MDHHMLQYGKDILFLLWLDIINLEVSQTICLQYILVLIFMDQINQLHQIQYVMLIHIHHIIIIQIIIITIIQLHNQNQLNFKQENNITCRFIMLMALVLVLFHYLFKYQIQMLQLKDGKLIKFIPLQQT